MMLNSLRIKKFVFDCFQYNAYKTFLGNTIFIMMPQPEPTTSPEMFTDIELNHVVNLT